MPRRVFKYDKSQGGVVEVTRAEDRKLCEAISQDVADRSLPMEFGAGTRPIAKWPIESDSMAIDPKDVPREQEYLRKRGILTDYTRDGRPILRDRAHKKAFQAAIGHCDPDAGYGDQAPVNFTSEDYRTRLRR